MVASHHPSPPTGSRPISVGLLPMSGFVLSSLSGFIDTLSSSAPTGQAQRQVGWTIVGDTARAVRASCGIELTPGEPPVPGRHDYVAVFGGASVSSDPLPRSVQDFLRRCAAAGTPLIGVGAGTFVLAQCGLMRGYRCAVSWSQRQDFVGEFPDECTLTDERYVVDRDRITCPGGVSAAHVAAFIIERHFGPEIAQRARRLMVIDRLRSPGWPQPQPLVARCTDLRVQRALLLMERDLSRPPSVFEIARQLDIGARQLNRLFKRHVGLSPAAASLALRLEYGRTLVVQTHRPFAEIAYECGFADGAHFSRKFHVAFGVTPTLARRGGALARPRRDADPGPRRIDA